MGRTNPLFPNLINADWTVWDDMVNSLIGRRLYSTAGKVDYNYDENGIDFSDGGSISSLNDRIIWNQQFPHAAKLDSIIKPHLHLVQANNNAVVFTMQYRIQQNGAATATSWTTMTANLSTDGLFPYVSGNLNQLLPLGDIDMTGYNVSATVEYRLARTDTTGGVALVNFADTHVEFDSAGSQALYTKYTP